jgi:hypothetical protein
MKQEFSRSHAGLKYSRVLYLIISKNATELVERSIDKFNDLKIKRNVTSADRSCPASRRYIDR